MNNKYYTYAYLREDGTPYYVGKGKGKRINERQHNRINLPTKERRIYLKQNLTEEEAFKHEIYMIAVFGRKDLRTGILQNQTNGGEGGSGAVRSKETKNKISKTMKNRVFSEEHKNHLKASAMGNKNGQCNKGKKHSPEFRENLRNKKRKPNDEVSSHALYMREYRKERQKYFNEEWDNIKRQKKIKKQTKTYQITFDDGRTIIVNGLIKFAKENGYSSGIFNVMKGKVKTHKDIVAVEKLDTTP